MGEVCLEEEIYFFQLNAQGSHKKISVAAGLVGKLRKVFLNKGKRHFHAVSVLQNCCSSPLHLCKAITGGKGSFTNQKLN